MYKILIHLAFVLSLSNSKNILENCPLDWSGGEDDYCYLIGTKEMLHFEAEEFCYSKNGTLVDNFTFDPPFLARQLLQSAEQNGDRYWWLSHCKELTLENMKTERFSYTYGNGVNCNLKRKPICEISLGRDFD